MSKIIERLSSWGPAALSYAFLAAAQLTLGLSMSNGTSYVMCGLAVMGAIAALAHKGKSFDEFRAGSPKPLIAFPWSNKTTHTIVCASMLLLCCELISTDLLIAPECAYVGALLSAIAGWLGRLAPEAPPASDPRAKD